MGKENFLLATTLFGICIYLIVHMVTFYSSEKIHRIFMKIRELRAFIILLALFGARTSNAVTEKKADVL